MSDHDRIEEVVPLEQGSPLDITLSLREDQLIEADEGDTHEADAVLEDDDDEGFDDLFGVGDEDDLDDEDEDVDDGNDSLDDIEW